MQPSDSSQAQIAAAIAILQDAIKKEAFDKKAVQDDVLKAVNILNEIIGLNAVGPDPRGGGIGH